MAQSEFGLRAEEVGIEQKVTKETKRLAAVCGRRLFVGNGRRRGSACGGQDGDATGVKLGLTGA